MNIDTRTIDRIVTGVLAQLGSGGEGADVSREASPSATETGPTVISEYVITADVLLGALDGESRIVVPERAIVTPAAWDAARERRVEIIRQSPRATPRGSAPRADGDHNMIHGTHGALPVGLVPLLIVVRHSDAVDRLWDDMQGVWRRELLGCPDDAATLAISAICRGDASTIVILAEQTHRAACLANRNGHVRAVAVTDAGDVLTIRRQLRANVWCIDPSDRSWFELRNLLRAIDAEEGL